MLLSSWESGEGRPIGRLDTDLQMTVEDVIMEDDKAVTRWTVRATHQGELMGIPPSGNRIEVIGLSVDRIEGGKFVQTWSSYDALGLIQQISAVPLSGAAQAEGACAMITQFLGRGITLGPFLEPRPLVG